MEGQQGRCMIIAWRWEQENQVKQWDIDNAEQDCLYCVKQSKDESSIKQILDIARKVISKTNNRIFIFLHQGSERTYTIASGNEIINSLAEASKATEIPRVKLFYFNSGDGPIYLRADSPYGLLGSKGFFELYSLSEQRLLTARVSEATNLLKFKHFDHTWKRYDIRLKARLIQVYDHTLTSLFEFTDPDKRLAGSVFKLLEGEKDIRQENFRLGISLRSIGLEHYAPPSSITKEMMEKYEEALQTINLEHQQAINLKHQVVLKIDNFQNTKFMIEKLYGTQSLQAYRKFAEATYQLLNEKSSPVKPLLIKFREAAIALLRTMPEVVHW